MVLGEGVDTAFSSNADAFRKKFGMSEPFILYVGRKDPAKGANLLLRFFNHYARNHNYPLRLVLIGPGQASIPKDMTGRILDLGYVPETDKHNAYSAALALCQPSTDESFSLMMMEAWACETPCVVNEECEVTKAHVLASGNGLYFRDADNFAGILDYLLAHPETARTFGKMGQSYVLIHYTWENVVACYCEFLKGIKP